MSLPDISDLIEGHVFAPPTEEGVAYCTALLEDCTTLDELRHAWESISPRYQRSVVKVKDRMKKQFS